MSAVLNPRLLPLAAALSLAFASPVHAQTQATDEQVLQAVQVTGSRAQGLVPLTTEAGSFRGANIMDVPSTVNVITRELLDLQGAAGLYDAVRNTAGVTRQQNGGETWDQLVIRGIAVENRTNYRLNGSMPIMNFSQVAMENKERVEVLKGASALYYGFTSPAGVVNFVTKRAASTPVTSLGLSLDDRGSAVANIDLGRRFGEQQQFGMRLNAAGGTLGSYLDHVGNGNRSFVSAALDWRVTNKLLLKADLEYDRRQVTEQAGVNLPTAVNGVITLPRAVDPSKLIGPDWARFEAQTKNAQLRADYALAGNWALTVEAGRSETARDRSLPIFRLNNAAALATGAGRITGNIQHGVNTSDLLRAELAGQFNTGFIAHELTLGASRTDKSQDAIYQRNYTIASQNLYNPVPVTNVVFGAAPTSPTTAALDTRDTGLYALDRLTFGPQWQSVVGVRRSSYRSDQGASHYDVSKTTPMASLIYKLTPDVSFYASLARGLEEGETAPTGTANQGVKMAPGVSRQQELGARWMTPNGTLLSAALFDIKRPGYYTNTSNLFTSDGEQRYRGLELSTQGKLTRQLSWQTSAQFLDPRFENINAQYNGKAPENASKRTASAFVSYAFDGAPGLSVNGGAYYYSARPVNDLNQAFLGGVSLFSAGARYAGTVMNKAVVWQLNVDNAFDKRYWAGAGTRLASGAPRAVKLSMKVDL
ncbi:TonB-dependent siderophore receptor [Janthinobacterium sp. PC23-8]|uniref:TonB-dependent siderophore receptor n=1 Tax=Janthinobacterium sp. PC23-8 TaxID=2012679 RepID=UPI000B96691A|nr:TonB-dependent siderophore receptor [Janthinobacterium sp. PC23-8]OYO28599.1 TonB-dependent siderophore receptor [Janthinobacterium sp. PC23-8]